MIESSLSFEQVTEKVHLFTGEMAELYTEHLNGYLSEKELERASVILGHQDQTTFITCRAYLRILLASYLKIPLEQVLFEHGVNGKLSVKGHKCYFNYSHANGSFVIVISRNAAVGVDIEHKNRKVAYVKLKDILFSEYEIDRFEQFPEERKNEVFLNCWTQKEAIFKAKGTGLSSPLKELELDLSVDREPRILRTAWSEMEKDQWTVMRLPENDQWIGTLAVNAGVDKIEVVCHDPINEFLNYLVYS
jgi:4'-phosphopantetheinyl transferase